MDINYDSWWLEEVKDHYHLFRKAVSLVLLSSFTLISGTSIYNSITGIDGYPAQFLGIFNALMVVLVSSLWYLRTHFHILCLVLAFICLEVLNIFLYLGSISILKEHKLILCIGSTAITLLYQIGFVKNIYVAVLVIIKHTFLWYTSKIFTGEIPSHMPYTLQGHIAVLLYVFMSEYLKRKKSFEKYSITRQLELTKRNLQTILDSFPNGMIVLTKNLEIRYANRKILESFICNQVSLLHILKTEKYIKDRRYFQGINFDCLLINDILQSFQLKNDQESALGLTTRMEYKYE